MQTRITRRHFGSVIGTGIIAASPATRTVAASAQSSKLSAGQIVDRLKQQLASENVIWKEPTSDTFKFGDPDTAVRGIATTFMSTLDVFQRAVAANLNLIISHEPTFWNHQDETDQFADDPVFLAKRRFAQENDLVVWRFHDFWHRRQPDPIFAALAQQLRWEPVSGGRLRYTIPTTTLEELGRQVQERLRTRNVRIVGDPQLRVTQLAMTAHRLASCARLLTDNDAILMGEPREFDTFEYFRDTAELGLRKGLIAVSHERLEEWGMLKPCAEWVQSAVPEVPVQALSARESYWLLPDTA